VLEARGKHLKSLIMFGSCVYNPVKARDLDLLIIVDRILNALEKHDLEIEVAKALRTIHSRMPVDVIVFDEDSFKENSEPGGLASGLAAGYRVIHDELGLEDLVTGLYEKLAQSEILVQKNRRKINLSALAKAKLRLLGTRLRKSLEAET